MDELLLNFPDKFPLSVHQAYKKQEEEIRKKNAKKQAAAAQVNNDDVPIADRRLSMLRKLERISMQVTLRDPNPKLMAEINLRVERYMVVAMQLAEPHGLGRVEQATYIKKLRMQMRKIQRACMLWESLKDAIGRHGVLMDDETRRMESDVANCPRPMQWAVWSRNLVTPPTESDFANLKDGHVDTVFRQQYLPRGGIAIVEHWRRDNIEMLTPLLQANDSDILKRQYAAWADCFAVSSKQPGTGKTKVSLTPFGDWTLMGFHDENITFAEEDVATIAGFLERLEGSTLPMQGAGYFGIQLTGWLNVSGMRAAESKKTWFLCRSASL